MPTRPHEFDIDARHAQVAQDPRIAPMKPGEFSDEAKLLVEQTFAHVEAIDKAEVPEYFAIAFKHPGIARSQMQFSLELASKGTLSVREREIAILRVAWLARAPFEWGEHVTAARKCGLTGEEIERITQGSTAEGWSDHERAILRAVEELMGDYAIATNTWEVLARSWSDQQLMELPGLVGHYLATALFQNSVRFELLEGNNGLRRR